MRSKFSMILIRLSLGLIVVGFLASGCVFGQNASPPNSSVTPDPKGAGAASPAAGAAKPQTPAPAKAAVPSAETKQAVSPPKIELQRDPLVDASGKPLYETIQEDWSSLQIGVSKLVPQTPIVGDINDTDKFVTYWVRLQWRPGDPVDLWIVMPKGVKKPPVVLYLYNYLEDPLRFHNDGWSERVTSGGVAAVGFLSALSSDRFRDRPMKQWFVSELQESLGSTVHDVKFILDYLASRGDLDMTRVGMFGEGSGGAIAILAAAADPRIKVVDTLEPWGDWPDFLVQSPVVSADPDREEYGKPEFLKKVAMLDPVKYLPTLKVPIRVQQIQRDLLIPMECKEAIKAALPKQAELVRFEGLSELASREKGGALFDWIKEKVQNSGDPQAEPDAKKSVAEGNVSDPKKSTAHP